MVIALTANQRADDAPSALERTCGHCGARLTTAGAEGLLAACSACGWLVACDAEELERPVETSVSSFSAELPPGLLLRDRYRIIRPLGRGAHGVTYLARHSYLGHHCVVKVLPTRMEDSSADEVKRLRNEALAGFRVDHPGVVRVFDCDAIDGLWYLVLEFVNGVDLSHAARPGAPRMPWQQALVVAREAAEALSAIHRAGLVHQDVKPANLMLGADGRVRLTDFGVTTVFESGDAGRAAARPSGTLAYAAPEVIEGTSGPSPSADLYSLGASLLELITGRPPHGGSVFRALLGASPIREWPVDAPADVPGWLAAGLMRLLAPDPGARFDSAEAFAEYLQANSGAAPAERAAEDEPGAPRGVVILPFEDRRSDAASDWLGHAVGEHIAKSMGRVPGALVADRDQFQGVLERVRRRSGLSHARSLREAGRLVGAATVVEGTLGRRGDEIVLEAVVHAAGREEAQRIGPHAARLENLAEAETALLRDLLRMLGAESLAADALGAQSRPPLEAEQRFIAARRSYLRGDYESAARSAREAAEMAPNYGESLGFVGVCCARAGRYEEAAAFNRRQEELARAQGDQRLLVEAFANRGTMHYFRGDYAAASEHLAAAVRVAEQSGLDTEVALIRNNLGFVELQLGRRESAADHFARAVSTHTRNGALASLIGPCNGLGHVLRDEGRYDSARQYFGRALALAQESDDIVNVGVAYMNLGHCALLKGRVGRAQHELAVALNILEQTGFWNGLARVYEYMAELNLRTRNWGDAVRCAERRVDLAQKHANRKMEAAAWRQKAEALDRAGRKDEADRARAAAEALEASQAAH